MNNYEKPNSFEQFGFLKQNNDDKIYKKYFNAFKVEFNNSNIIDSIKTIVLFFSKNGKNGGCGDYSDNLIKNLFWVSQGAGHGCCSDHAQLFLAFCLANNIKARIVHNYGHTFNEFYSVEKNKWIWVDPEYCLLAKNIKEEYLSALEIYQNYQKNLQSVFVFFGNKNHFLYEKQIFPTYNLLGGKEAFSILMISNGNNIYQVDYWNNNLKILPKSI